MKELMPVERLFTPTDLWGDLGNKLTPEIRKALDILFKDAFIKNHSLRDLSHMIIHEAIELESEYSIRRGLALSDPPHKFSQNKKDPPSS